MNLQFLELVSKDSQLLDVWLTEQNIKRMMKQASTQLTCHRAKVEEQNVLMNDNVDTDHQTAKLDLLARQHIGVGVKHDVAATRPILKYTN